MKTRILTIAIICLASMSASKCKDQPSKEMMNKIEFDYSSVDEKGLLNGTVALDYEFCIPKDEAKVNEIKSIVPNVTMPRMAKGRIKCSEEEWLCIVSTNDASWKEQLYKIASLKYVKKIVPTYYE
ncbi:MAG: hypothetical protein M3R25_14865 [Bacteroidota bacterium]|nr:hypothetical protein [Bacteroidota bacterium]